MASLTEGKIRFLTVESLLIRSGIHFDPYQPEAWEACLGILRKFQDLEMIECQENGDITLLNWEKRQETNLTDAERAKSYRDRKRERHANVTNNVTTVTQEESRVDKSRVDKRSTIVSSVEPQKDTYGEFNKVKLTGEQFDKLIEDLGQQPTDTLIMELDQYIAGKGKDPYKDHCAVIKAWYRKRLQEHASKFQPSKPKMV